MNGPDPQAEQLLGADRHVYVDLDGYNAAVARWSFRASALTFVIGLFGGLAVLQEDLAVRVAFGSVTACIIVARVAVAGRRPDIDNYVRRDP